MSDKLRYGIFMGPLHATAESPTVALRRDLELVRWIDELGFDEAWFGEHHSSGMKTIASPELMIAAAAETTRRIRLGTGVISLPYHNPLMTANRILQLDHMTLGRAMFGFGPGILPLDATMLGLDVSKTREMMVESLEVILRLLRGETVTCETSWFKLDQARTHLRPYTWPHPEITVASSITPSGAMLAGRLGLSLLCVAATDSSGFEVLSRNWNIVKTLHAERGEMADHRGLRLVVPMHIAETREKARANVAFGIRHWCQYFDNLAPKGLGGLLKDDRPIDVLIESGRAVIGTPDDAIAMINRLRAQQGQFGTILIATNDWADWEATKKSYELFARYVMPHFDRTNVHRAESFEIASGQIASIDKARQAGMDAAFAQWQAHENAAPPAA